MKKIIAIALAFVMVFAIAATAMASIGITVVDLPSTNNVGVAIEKLKQAEDSAGKAYWVSMGSTEGTKPGFVYGAKVTITLPVGYTPASDTSIVKYSIGTIAKGTLTNLKTDVATALTPDTDGDDDGTLADAIVNFANTGDKAITYKFLFSFVAAMDTDDDFVEDALKTVLKITVTDNQDLTSAATAWTAGTGFYMKIGGVDYVAFKLANLDGGAFAITSVTPDVYYGIANKSQKQAVALAAGAARTDGYREVCGVFVTIDSGAHWYEAYGLTVGGELAFRNGEMKIVAGDDGFADLQAALNKYLGVMGWSFSGNMGWICDKDFTAKAGYTGEAVYTVTFAPYILTLTVSGPAATVPDTGDMNVVGIVMIAVAILTVAAVAVKKVRA